jgi:hypothetical protein
LRDARRQLDEPRHSEARPIARSRAERLQEAKRRLEEQLAAERAAHAAYEAYRARGVMKDGRRFGRPPDPHTPPQTPTATIDTTDHDARVVRTAGQPAKQGDNARAAVNDHQILVAAEIAVDAPDFGHLEPMVDATTRELEKVGVTESPETIVAAPGYWHKKQMENIVSRGIQVLIPPDSGLRKDARPGWNKGLYAFMRRALGTTTARRSIADAWRRSSRCSDRSSSTAASTGSNDEEDPRRARSGGWWRRPTTCSSSTTTESPSQGHERPPKRRVRPTHRGTL